MQELAVVIGAGGLGAAVAGRLARRYRVLLADIDHPRAAAVADKLCGEGGAAYAIECDVTDPGKVQLLADRVGLEGGLRVLAHVAGLSPSMGDFDTIMRVNLVGPALVSDALLPHARPGAAAIMIASVGAHMCQVSEEVLAVLRDAAGSHNLPDLLRPLIGEDQANTNMAYQLSKYGLLMLCRRRVTDWSARGARILSLSPGIIATPMGALEFESNPAKRAMFENSPQKRVGTMDEVADVLEYLVSDRASFISGTDILVDGGLAGAMTDVPFGAFHETNR